MGVNDVGAHPIHHALQAARERVHELKLTHQRQWPLGLLGGGAEKVQTVNGFFGGVHSALLGRSDMKGLPTARALFAQQGGCAKGVAAVQRDGMVQNVKNSHDQARLTLRLTARQWVRRLMGVER